MNRLILALALEMGGGFVVFAQEQGAPTGAEVEVVRVQSGRVRGTDGTFWYQIEVGVRTRGHGSCRAKFANRVKMTLNLATEVGGTPSDLEFYRSTTTAVALAPGPSVFRYYLPPEVVTRDRLQGAARFWAIDLSVDGRVAPTSRALIGDGFSTPAALQNFRLRVAQEAERNDGILLPEHLTFYPSADGAETTPTMMRPEGVGLNP